MNKNDVFPVVLLLGSFAAVADDGAAIYRKQCAECHDESSVVRAPRADALKNLSAEQALAALTDGAMKTQGAALNEADRREVTEFVTGKRFGAARTAETASGAC